MHKIDSNDIAHVIERFGAENIAGWMPAPTVDGKINPHVSQFLLKNNEVCKVFHVKPIYYQTLQGHWRPLDEVAYHVGNHKVILKENWMNSMHPSYLRWLMSRMVLLNGRVSVAGFSLQPHHYVYNTTSTFYPSPGATVDGWIICDPTTSQTFANIRTLLTGDPRTSSNDSSTNSTNAIIWRKFDNVSGGWRNASRDVFLFDTSSIGSGNTVTAATLSLYNGTKNFSANPFGATYTITSSNPTSNTALVVADGDLSKFGSTEYISTRPTWSGWANNTYQDFVFNSTGMAAISKTSISKFGLRLGADVDNVEPTVTADTYEGIDLYFSDATGTANDPKLVVTYGIAVAPGDTFMMGANF